MAPESTGKLFENVADRLEHVARPDRGTANDDTNFHGPSQRCTLRDVRQRQPMRLEQCADQFAQSDVFVKESEKHGDLN
jgi:hypothetical protein